MAEENENYEGEESEQVEQTPTWALSQDDWKQLQQNQIELTNMVKSLFEPEEEYYPQMPEPGQFDLNDPRQLAALVGAVVDDRMSTISPYVRNAAQDQGKREMYSMFDGFSDQWKEEFPDGFDKDLAERTAHYFFEQTGDAAKSVEEAARYAATIRKSDREAAVDEVRSRATRRGYGATDEPGGTTAVPAREPAGSYDEVIERYTHQTEL